MSSRELPHIQDLIQRFAETKRSGRTAKTYGTIAARFLFFLGNQRTPQRRDVEAFLALPLKSNRRGSAATYNQALWALRSYGKFAVREGLWSDDPTRDVEPVPAEQKEATFLSVPEAQRFMRAVRHVSPPELQSRDLAILAVDFTIGLRLRELERLDLPALNLLAAELLDVRRKGARVQNLPLAKKAVRLIRAWLIDRPRFAKPGELSVFVSRRGSRLSGRSHERLYERICVHLRLAKHVTPHTGRHSFVTNSLNGGAQLKAVSNVAGHSSIATTMKYAHVIDPERRHSVEVASAAIPPELVPGPDDAVMEAAPGRFDSKASAVGWLSEPWVVNSQPANDVLDDQDHLDDIA